MKIPKNIDGELILGVARKYHERAELEYEEDERVPFDDLDEDDIEFILYESEQWLRAADEYLRSRSE